MESEMQSKHRKKKKLQKDTQSLNIQLKTPLNSAMCKTLMHQINIAIKSPSKFINLGHEKKLIEFRKNQQKIRKYKDPEILKRTLHNFSSYTLTSEEMNALA